MKAIKGLLLFGISLLTATACFNPPEMGILPTIGTKDLYFRAGPTGDSLIFTIDFKDGDGNLGLGAGQIEPPYHDRNMYLANNGDTIALAKATLANDPLGRQALIVPQGKTGKLVTSRTREDPAYSYLPIYIDKDESCYEYTYDSVYVIPPDKGIFDNSYNIVDTLRSGVFVLLDTFYYRPNPNHYNIDVRVFFSDGKEYVWEKEFCTISPFKGRFPILAEEPGPLEGTLRFSVVSSGLRNVVFGARPLTFRITIRDTDLNASNTIEIGPVTLDEITRN